MTAMIHTGSLAAALEALGLDPGRCLPMLEDEGALQRRLEEARVRHHSEYLRAQETR